jgi:hypothetical protein
MPLSQADIDSFRGAENARVILIALFSLTGMWGKRCLLPSGCLTGLLRLVYEVRICLPAFEDGTEIQSVVDHP